MKQFFLTAEIRTDLGKKLKKMRDNKQIPAVLYGPGIKNKSIALGWSEFLHVYREAGESTLIDLTIDDQKPVKVLIVDPQLDPLTDKIIHVDLKQIKMDQPIRTQVPIEVLGERDAPAIRDLEGTLILNKDHLEIECLPADLISEVPMDVSGFETFEDKIHVKDLKVPENVSILDDQEEVVALVNPPRSEEELEELEEKPQEDVEGVEIEEKGKVEEGEEGAEGETTEPTAEGEAKPTGQPQEQPKPQESK